MKSKIIKYGSIVTIIILTILFINNIFIQNTLKENINHFLSTNYQVTVEQSGFIPPISFKINRSLKQCINEILLGENIPISSIEKGGEYPFVYLKLNNYNEEIKMKMTVIPNNDTLRIDFLSGSKYITIYKKIVSQDILDELYSNINKEYP